MHKKTDSDSLCVFNDIPGKALHVAIKIILICGAIGLTCVFAQHLDADEFYDKYYKRRPYIGWKYIVIHHSATKNGNAASFHRYHSEKGYGGLCYHFVIGNGRGAGNGIVETGFRWKEQMAGTHCSVNAWEYNIWGIGICLVGNLEEGPATPEQMNALVSLTATLMKEHKIPIENIVGHRGVPFDDNPGRHEPTRCPGKHFSIKELKKRVLENNMRQELGQRESRNLSPPSFHNKTKVNSESSYGEDHRISSIRRDGVRGKICTNSTCNPPAAICRGIACKNQSIVAGHSFCRGRPVCLS